MGNQAIVKELEVDSRSTYRIPLDKLMGDPSQPRKTFNEERLKELEGSLKNGQFRSKVIEVRPHPDQATYPGFFLIIDGERRLRAARAAGLSHLLCVISAVTDVAEIHAKQIVSNMLADSGLPMENADGFRFLVSHGWSVDEIHRKTGKSIETIKQDLALSENLKHSELRIAVDTGTLPKEVAREIGTFPMDKQLQAWSWAQKGKNVKAMKGHLAAYRTKMEQDATPVLSDSKTPEENKEIVKAGKAFNSYAKRLGDFFTGYGNGGAVYVAVAKKNSLGEVKSVLTMMKDIHKNLEDAVIAQEAKNMENQPLRKAA